MSLRIWVHELKVDAQKCSHMVGSMRPNASLGACRPALKNSLGRLHILRQAAFSLDSMAAMEFGDNVIKQCVYKILEEGP